MTLILLLVVSCSHNLSEEPIVSTCQLARVSIAPDDCSPITFARGSESGCMLKSSKAGGGTTFERLLVGVVSH